MVSLNNLTDTWNTPGGSFTALKYNVTDTASAATSYLLDFQVGGVSKFRVDKTGLISPGTIAAPAYNGIAGLTLAYASSTSISINTGAAADSTNTVWMVLSSALTK